MLFNFIARSDKLSGAEGRGGEGRGEDRFLIPAFRVCPGRVGVLITLINYDSAAIIGGIALYLLNEYL